MNWQPDPTAPVFPDQIHMEEFGMVGRKRICKERVISKDNFFSIDCTNKTNLEPDNWLYVLPNSTGTFTSIPASASIHEYTHGFFTMASVGVQGVSQVLGRLFVGVELDFAICAVPPPNTTTQFAHYQNASTTSGVSPTTANNFASLTLQPGSTLTGGTITPSGGYIFPATVSNGQFLVVLAYQGASCSAAAWSVPGGRCTGYNLIGNAGLADQISAVGIGGGGSAVTIFFLTVTGVAPSIALATPSTITGGTNCDMYIIGIPFGVNALPPQLAALDTITNKLERQERQILQLMKALDLQCADTGQKRLMPPDSDFDDDDCKTVSNSSSSSSTLSGGSLSNSTILQVVEHLKSSSHKK